MKAAKKPSPARSEGQYRTHRREKTRRTRSVESPTSNSSGRLTSVLESYKEVNDSFALVLAGRKSVLTDNTDVADEPRRKSWWKKLNEDSQDVMEIFEDNNIVEPNNIIEELNMEILSQENQKKNYTIDLPESSDGESINSIVLPQRRLFTQPLPKAHQPQKKFQNKQRLKPMFPAALPTSSTPEKTLGDKTKEFATAEPKGQVRNLFGNRAGTKHKNKFANFVVSESEDEFPKKSLPQRRGSSQSKRSLRESSPASVTTDIEMDDWQHLPSSTMIQENQKKNYTIDLSESSDGESINSIVLPQRRHFTQPPPKAHQPQKKFGEIMGTRDTLAKIKKNTTVIDKTITAGTKELFQNKQRSKPMFPAALANSSTPEKTLGDKTKEFATAEPKGQVPNIFGNRAGTKRKNMFANFILSESEDEFPKKSLSQRRGSSQSKTSLKESSPPSVTTNIEMDDRQHSPSSTMVEHQFEAMFEGVNSPVKRPRLGKLSQTKESEASNKSKENKSAKNSSKERKNTSKVSSEVQQKDHTSTQNTSQEQDNSVNKSKTNKSVAKNSSIVTRNRSKVLSEENEKEHTLTQNNSINQANKSKGNKSKNESGVKNKSKTATDDLNESGSSKNTSKQETQSNKSTSKNKSLLKNKTLVNDNDRDVTVTDMQTHEQNKETNELNAGNQSNKIQQDESGNEVDQSQEEQGESGNKVDQSQEEQNESGNKVDQSQQKQVESDNVIVQCNEQDASDNEVEQEIVEENEEIDEGPADENEDLEQSHENDTQSDNDENDEQSDNVIDQSQKQDASDNKAEQETVEENEEIDEEQADENEDVEQSQENDTQSDNDENDEQSDDVINQSHEQDASDNEVEQEIVEEIDEGQAYENEDVEQSQENDTQSDNDENDEQNDNVIDQSHEQDASDNEVEQEIVEENDEIDEEQADEKEDVEQSLKNDTQSENDEQSDNVIDQSHEQDASDNEDEEQADENEDVEQSQENDTQSDNEESHEQESEKSENDANLHYDSEEMEVDNENETNESTNQDSTNQKEIIENSQNISHDTTGRKRTKNQTLDILRESSGQNIISFSNLKNTSLRRTSMIKNMTAKASLLPPRDSVGFSDGTTNSSAEGSGWDSHRTTRKTIRQTFGKDFSIRKSLRTLVMEKSAKRQTLANKEGSEPGTVQVQSPLANSTEYPGMSNMDCDDQESTHEVSLRTRQTNLEAHLQMIKMEWLERRTKWEGEVKKSLEARTFNPSKVPAKLFPRNPLKTINKVKKQPNLSDIPEELIKDMQYKPPKRFRPPNAAWATNRLYKYLETKLEPRYDYRARVRAENLVEAIYQFTKDLRRQKVASTESIDKLKYKMARLNIVKTHWDFYGFFEQFMPREVRVKVVPDVVNKIPLPKPGPLADIIPTRPSVG